MCTFPLQACHCCNKSQLDDSEYTTYCCLCQSFAHEECLVKSLEHLQGGCYGDDYRSVLWMDALHQNLGQDAKAVARALNTHVCFSEARNQLCVWCFAMLDSKYKTLKNKHIGVHDSQVSSALGANKVNENQ